MQRFVPSIRRSAACATSARAAGAGSTPVVPGIYVGRLGTESSVFRVAHDDRGVTYDTNPPHACCSMRAEPSAKQAMAPPYYFTFACVFSVWPIATAWHKEASRVGWRCVSATVACVVCGLVLNRRACTNRCMSPAFTESAT
jgi:hypothetical protein